MKTSIVTPSFNQGAFLRRTLDSVAMQSNCDIDHIVFDGGSTDDSRDVLEIFPGKLTWHSERDKGQTDAVNKGIRASDGEIIGWLNSDDVYYPGAIEKVVAVFVANPDIDVVYGMADHIDEVDHAFEAYPSEPWDFERLKETCFICQPTAFFRRRVVDRYGLLDENLHYCMDYEFWLRLGKAGARFFYLKQKLAGSRLYPGNKTLGSRIKVHAEINDVLKRLFETTPDRWLWNYAHAVVEDRVDRTKQPRWFEIRLALAVIRAAFRWNGRVSPEMRATLLKLWKDQRLSRQH